MLIDRTFEAVVIGCRPRPLSDVESRIERLRAAGVYVVVLGEGFDREELRVVVDRLAQRGVTGELVLVVSDGSVDLTLPELARAYFLMVRGKRGSLPAAAGQLESRDARIVELLDAQLVRRQQGRVADIDFDPAWVVVLPASPAMDGTAEALGTLSNGWAGVRASREEGGVDTAPLFAVSGVYTGGEESHLLGGPVWTGLVIRDGVPDERMLDLRTGVLVRSTGTGVRTLRFVSAARRDALGLRAEGPASALDGGSPFTGPDVERRHQGVVELARCSDRARREAITVAARDQERLDGDRRFLERLAAWVADGGHSPGWDAATERLHVLAATGFDRLLAEHRAAWAQLWSDATVTIDGAPDDELAARFAVFHLLSAAPDEGEAAVGARGLTGPAYGGHVFWDADVFVLPALAAVRPTAARAMLQYRLRGLDAARQAAIVLGLRGARFPWESAADGRDVTPQFAQGVHGERIPIRTGMQEEHIVADVAWAACEYAAWTGDKALLEGVGAALILETARFWASRVRVDHRGRGHVYGVMGPDEYHDAVDDNAYTNVMARWNLERAAELVELLSDAQHEASEWRRLAAGLVDGWDSQRGLYEQFAGYWGLEPLRIADFAAPPVAADVLLGPDRVRTSQLIKQADVLMLHHLVPDQVRPGSLAANLAFYEPRTCHGSSLSPAIHAALFARAHQPERSLELFRIAARLDLADVTGNTPAGLHLAAMGGVWQALAYGFLGARPRGEVLDLDPCLPAAWQGLSMRFRFRGSPVKVHATHDAVVVSSAAPLEVRLPGQCPVRCDPPSSTFPIERSTQ